MPDAEPTQTPVVEEAICVRCKSEGVLFSEFLPGVPGNNNYEFIELYNAGQEPVDLAGWSIWYRLNDSQEPQLVYEWREVSEIPGWGHYLLLRAGQSYDVMADVEYEIPLFERRGGLVLQNGNGDIVDRLGWGDGVADFYAGEPSGCCSC